MGCCRWIWVLDLGIGFGTEKCVVCDHTLCSFSIWGLNRGLPRDSFGVFLNLAYGFPRLVCIERDMSERADFSRRLNRLHQLLKSCPSQVT